MSKIIELTDSEIFWVKKAVTNLQSDLISKRVSSTGSDRLYFMDVIKELESLSFKLREI